MLLIERWKQRYNPPDCDFIFMFRVPEMSDDRLKESNEKPGNYPEHLHGNEFEEQKEKYHKQITALHTISKAVSELYDLDSILGIAIDNVLNIIDGNIGGILLMDREPGVLYYRAYQGFSSERLNRVKITVGDGIAGRVAETGRAILVEDISKDPRTVNLDIVNAEGLKGFISIPLKSKDRVLGVMNIASHRPGEFDDEDLSLLNSIGDYLGTAIEQANLYERLSRIAERNRVLLKYALTGQEDERKRIARELHDEASMAMTSLTLSIEAAIQMAEKKGFDDTQFIQPLKNAQSYAARTNAEILRLMRELRPTLLDEFGVPTAIRRYVLDTLKVQGIEAKIHFTGRNKRLPVEIETTLYRIAQGLISNILEHSEAKNVSIELEYTPDQCKLVVRDDGKGFDVNHLKAVEPGGRGAGLFTMRERARLLGGTGFVESKPGQGTIVTVTLPLSDDVTDTINFNNE
jgi:signal transduction histidine kinase